MIIPVVRRVLEKNDAAAEQNRQTFDRHGIFTINLLGGAGSGKTSLLEAVLPRLKGRLRAAVVEGDLTTTRDAERIAALGVRVVQLMTDGGCHLTAAHVQRGLAELDLADLDLLVIENVGNPICPANFDLGEHARITVLSVAEGDDKPSKYPLLFRKSELTVFSKCDLLAAVDFDPQRAAIDVRRVRPDAEILKCDVRTPRGVDELADWMTRRAAARSHPQRRRNPAWAAEPARRAVASGAAGAGRNTP